MSNYLSEKYAPPHASLGLASIEAIEKTLEVKLPEFYREALMNNPFKGTDLDEEIFWNYTDRIIATNVLNRKRGEGKWPEGLQIGRSRDCGVFILLSGGDASVFFCRSDRAGEVDFDERLKMASSIPEFITVWQGIVSKDPSMRMPETKRPRLDEHRCMEEKGVEDVEVALEIRLPKHYRKALLRNPFRGTDLDEDLFWTSAERIIADNFRNMKGDWYGQEWPKDALQIGSSCDNGAVYIAKLREASDVYFCHWEMGEDIALDDHFKMADSIPEFIDAWAEQEDW